MSALPTGCKTNTILSVITRYWFWYCGSFKLLCTKESIDRCYCLSNKSHCIIESVNVYYSNFMQISGNFGRIIGWRPHPPFEVGTPSGKSFIRHWYLSMVKKLGVKTLKNVQFFKINLLVSTHAEYERLSVMQQSLGSLPVGEGICQWSQYYPPWISGVWWG